MSIEGDRMSQADSLVKVSAVDGAEGYTVVETEAGGMQTAPPGG
jgi:hypothetical protein